MEEFQNTLRALAGLGVALRLFDSTRPFDPTWSRTDYWVHRRHADSLAFDSECWWNADHAKAFRLLSLDTLDGQLETVAEQAAWMTKALRKLEVVFTQHEKGRRIRLGAQWLFDSLCTSDQPLAFVQATVVMEVLLGDKAESEKVGITNLLANRCAYLIGSTLAERQRLIEQFKDTYDVRSAIVHGGKSALTTSEVAQLILLRFMCMAVIRKEVELLEREANEG
jgi:hypothetical protein